MSFNSRVSTSIELFTYKFHNLHVEIAKQIQDDSAQYKLQFDLLRHHNVSNAKSYVMTWIRPEQYPIGANQKL